MFQLTKIQFLNINIMSFEDKIGKYKNRMELLRTIIGLIVLCFQIAIVFNLFSKWK
jgi:hypothetical protein